MRVSGHRAKVEADIRGASSALAILAALCVAPSGALAQSVEPTETPEAEPADADPQFHTAEFRNDVLTICFMKTGNPVRTTRDRVIVY